MEEGVKEAKHLVDVTTSDDYRSGNKDQEVKAEQNISSEITTPDSSKDDVGHPDVESGGEVNENASEVGPMVPQNGGEEEQEVGENLVEEKESDPVFDGTEGPELEATHSMSSRSIEQDPEVEQSSIWPEKAVQIKNFVKEKGTVAVSSLLRRLSGRKDEDVIGLSSDQEGNISSMKAVEAGSSPESRIKDALQKAGDFSTWNPLKYIKGGREIDGQNKLEQVENVDVENKVEQRIMKGRIIVYTRLGCQDCKEVRLFLLQRKVRFVEINIDIYPSRKLELEKNTGSSVVPQVYFNDLLVGGLPDLKRLDDSGNLEEKFNFVFDVEPSLESPSPPLPGEDDTSGNGKVDELAVIVRKMRESIVSKDRFYKMRKFGNCFLGSEAVDFLSEDQYLEREDAVEFGRKLATHHFFRHVLDENLFEDGNHLYRFLDHEPVVMAQCYNIPRGTIDAKPKTITEIASRLRLLFLAIVEAYVSEDGRHVDYARIHGSEEFQRYIRITEDLQRITMDDLSREDKLSFFINLYNMMAIHAILIWGFPVRALDRRKFLGDFKYVVGGCTYSLSAIQNGILRGNQRPPYNLIRPFGPKDKRSKVALPYPEPLVHFALVCGTRSGPALRCYSPGNIDTELMENARDFMRNGGLVVDAQNMTVSASKILRWYSSDFGRNETEVLKHAANYLEPAKSGELLELLANNNAQVKVTYQTYDWGLNYYYYY